MILVDSSVWIDFLNANHTFQTFWLRQNLGSAKIAIGDLILTEVLQGCRTDRDFNAALSLLSQLPLITICDREVAVAAARHYRLLRAKGVTIRRTVDGLIATRCIADDLLLVHGDRDFEPFQTYLGLRVYNVA